MPKTLPKRKIVHSTSDIPKFKNELEESDWWDTHTLAPELWESGPEVDAELDKLLGIKRKNAPKKAS